MSAAEELAAIRARAEAATPGPWTLYDQDAGTELAGRFGRIAIPDSMHSVAWPANAKFIAHARTDVPRLLAAVDAVLALCDEADSRGRGVDPDELRDAVHGDAPNEWNATDPPGGMVCSACQMPVESEPCPDHQPRAHARYQA